MSRITITRTAAKVTPNIPLLCNKNKASSNIIITKGNDYDRRSSVSSNDSDMYDDDTNEYFKEEDTDVEYDIDMNDPEQKVVVDKVIEIFSRITDDGSEEPSNPATGIFCLTGSGKTIMSILVAMAMGLDIIVYCPAGATMTWITHLEKMGYMNHLKLISSLGTAADAKCYDTASVIKRSNVNSTRSCKHYYVKGTSYDTHKKQYVWDEERCKEMFNNTVIIVDEAHMITTNSQRSMFFVMLFNYLNSNDGNGTKFKQWNVKIILQTATIAEKLERYARVCFFLRIIPDEKNKTFLEFLQKTLKDAHSMGLDKNADQVTILKRYMKNENFPYAVGMKRPKYPFLNTIKVELFSLGKEVSQKIEEMNQKIADMIKTSNKGNKKGMDKIQSMRKKVEALMIPLYVAIVKGMLLKGYHVSVFMCFLDTIDELKEQLKQYNPIVVTGKVSNKALRDQYQKDFREGKCRLIILSVGVGSTSISLHDTRGAIRADNKMKAVIKAANNIRYGNRDTPSLSGAHASVLSLIFCVIDFLQMIGRLYRRGLKSDVYQLLPLVKGTSHEAIARNIVRKMGDLENFNDDVPHSENFYAAMEGEAKSIEYDDIRDRDDLSEVINGIIPDITEETFRIKEELLKDKPLTPILHNIVTDKSIGSKWNVEKDVSEGKIQEKKLSLTPNIPHHIKDHNEVSGYEMMTKNSILHPNTMITKKLHPNNSLKKSILHPNMYSNNDTTVVKIKKDKYGNTIQDCDIYIGREMNYGVWKGTPKSKWSNPYVCSGIEAQYTLEESLFKYEKYICSSSLMNQLLELKGKRLGCWCSDDNSPSIMKNPKCHGHILIKLLKEVS